MATVPGQGARSALAVGLGGPPFPGAPRGVLGAIGASCAAGVLDGGAYPFVGNERGGQHAPGHWRQIEDRIIAKPMVIETGMVAQVRQYEGLLWSNHRSDDAVLSEIARSGAEGITVSGIEEAGSLTRTRDVLLTYTVTIEGPLDIAAMFRYLFDVGAVRQRLTGLRGVVLRSPPLQPGYGEARSWATSIHRSDSGVEKRVSVLEDNVPVRAIRFPVAAFSREELSRLEHALSFGAGQALLVPLWYSRSVLASGADESMEIALDTTLREFLVGGYVLLLSHAGRFAVRQVLAASAAGLTLNEEVKGFQAGDFVLPLILATAERVAGFGATSERHAKGVVVFEEIGDRAFEASAVDSPVETYLGIPVFDYDPEQVMSWAARNEYELLGDVRQKRRKWTQEATERVIQVGLRLPDLAALDAMRRFFDGRRGREAAFWVRSKRPNMRLAAAAQESATEIEVDEAGQVAGLTGLRRHAWSPRTGGMFGISNATLVGNGDRVRLEISPALAAELQTGDDLHEMYLVRFDSDTLGVDSPTGLVEDVRDTEFVLQEVQGETP